MPLNSFISSGTVYASGGSVGFADVRVTCRNDTRKDEMSITTGSNGAYSFNLANFKKGYANSDSVKIIARIGCYSSTYSFTVDTSKQGEEANLTLALDSRNRVFDISLLKEELVAFLRNNLNDPLNRLSTKTDVFTADGSTVKFILSQTNAKSISLVSVGATAKTQYDDYYVDYKDKDSANNPAVYILSPPANGQQVEITYRYGNSDWVYPDFPRTELRISDYPRVMVEVLTGTSRDIGIGGVGQVSDWVITVRAWDLKQYRLDDILLGNNGVRELFVRNKKNFRYAQFITPESIGPLNITSDRAGEIMQRTLDFSIVKQVEIID